MSEEVPFFRLSAVNSLKLVAIIEETLSKLKVLGSLVPGFVRDSQQVNLLTEKEVDRIVASHARLEEEYKQIIEERDHLSKFHSLTAKLTRSKINAMQEKIEAVSRNLKFATKILCLNLEQHPDIPKNILYIESLRQLYSNILTKLCDELLNEGTYASLRALVNDEYITATILNNLTTEQQKDAIELAKIEAEIQLEKEEMERETARQKAEIVSLNKKFKQLNLDNAVLAKETNEDIRANEENTETLLKNAQSKYQEVIDKMNKEKVLENTVTETFSNFLEESQRKIQEQVNEWMNKYDFDTENLIRKLETLKNQKANDLVSLFDNREKLKMLIETVATEKNVQQMQAEQKELAFRQCSAAVFIQKVWRGYRARKKYRLMKRRAALRAKKLAKQAKKKR